MASRTDSNKLTYVKLQSPCPEWQVKLCSFLCAICCLWYINSFVMSVLFVDRNVLISDRSRGKSRRYGVRTLLALKSIFDQDTNAQDHKCIKGSECHS